VATLILAAAACEPAPSAAPPPASPAAVAPAATAPAAAAPSGAQQASPAAPPEQGEADEHRHHHNGGVIALIAMSLKDLNLAPDQKTAVEKIRTALLAKMEPSRAAGQDLANTLADGVAAGSVDRAKADAAIDKLAAQVQATQGSSLDAMNQLHAVLTPAQRAALIDKLQEHFEKWKEANGHEDQEGQHRSGPMLGLVKDLSLSQTEAQQIKDSYRNLLKASAPAAGGQDHQHKEVADHLQAFGTAFKADKFDARSMAGASAAGGHMAKWGATRMARFLEAAAPVLTPDQRAKLAQLIRDRAGQHAS
jgi:Spy/CpxP family protein refolding chaperone